MTIKNGVIYTVQKILENNKLKRCHISELKTVSHMPNKTVSYRGDN